MKLLLFVLLSASFYTRLSLASPLSEAESLLKGLCADFSKDEKAFVKSYFPKVGIKLIDNNCKRTVNFVKKFGPKWPEEAPKFHLEQLCQNYGDGVSLSEIKLNKSTLEFLYSGVRFDFKYDKKINEIIEIENPDGGGDCE